MEIDPIEFVETLNRLGSDTSVISIMEKVQAKYRYLPREALLLINERSNVPLSQLYSIATFYNAFSLNPRGKHSLHVCTGTACHVRGAVQILNRLTSQLQIAPGETTKDRLFTLETVNCLGCCALGPVAVMDDEYIGQLTTQKVDKLLKQTRRQSGSTT
jgi:NADH-quinone oxidoreductase subunit E